MPEYDVYARIIEIYGPLSERSQVSAEQADRFRDRLPPKLIDFWLAFGWGSWNEGYFWLCDPSPFDHVMDAIFAGDKEFKPRDLTLIGYTALSRLKIWDRNGRTILISLDRGEVSAQPHSATVDPDTNLPYSADFLLGLMIEGELKNNAVLYKRAIKSLGIPTSGEIFGYAPALQLGGEKSVENLNRVSADSYMSFIAQLEPMKLVRLSAPSQGFPLGDIETVRLIGE